MPHPTRQVAVVTGALGGIGRATVRRLLQDGWAVAASYAQGVETPEQAMALKAELGEDGEFGDRISLHPLNLAHSASIRAFFTEVLAAWGRLDALVNNAGGQYRTPMKTISTKGFEAVVRNNLTGGFIFMREVYNRWMEANGGAIVNIIADIWHGWPEFAHSGAARGGMLTLTETAACEWSAAGVRVNSVAPGGIASSGFDTYAPEIQDRLFEYAERVPMQRFGTEAEVAGAIVYLLSPAAAYITGTCLRVDGGAPNARTTWNLQAHKNSQAFEGFHRSRMPEVLARGRRTATPE